jgi:ribosomal protein L37AE/L43A
MAVAKVCPNCGGKSVSAAEYGEWFCPYCGEDLTEEGSTHA